MFDAIILALKTAKRVGIFTHQNPDGDAMGSAYSLKLALTAMGKEAEVYLLDNPDALAYSLMAGTEETGLAIEDCDLLAAVDCADSRRLGEHETVFLNHPNTVALDHHITHKPFAKQTVVEDISSTCELMVMLYEAMDVSLSKDMVNNLYLGMVCDTGGFRYSCTTADTMRRAATLIEQGAEFAKITKRVFHTKSKQYYTLMRTALERLQFLEEGQVCVLSLTEQDFADADLNESMATGIVTLPTGIEGVEAGVYIRRRSENEYKISLRSVERVDVAKIAESLGGGGHVRASGFSAFDTTPEAIVATLLPKIKEQL